MPFVALFVALFVATRDPLSHPRQVFKSECLRVPCTILRLYCGFTAVFFHQGLRATVVHVLVEAAFPSRPAFVRRRRLALLVLTCGNRWRRGCGDAGMRVW